MVYRIAEGSLALVGQWQDQSLNVLLPKDAAVSGANLVVARDRLPLGLTFEQYVAQQRQTFAAQLAGYEATADAPGQLDGRPAHFLELSWRSDGRPVHQVMAMVLCDGELMLHFTGSIPGRFDAATRDAIIAAIRSFTFA